MPTEFEWKIFPGITTLGLVGEIQSLMTDLQCEPEHFTDRIIFMSMYNDIKWKTEGNIARCAYNSRENWDRTAEMMLQLFRIRSSNISCLQCLWERRINEAKKEARSQYTSMAVMKTSSRFSALISPNQLSIFGAIADLCKELSEDSESSGTIWSIWSFGDDGNSCWPPYQRTATETPGARLWAQIRTIVWWPGVIQTMPWRWFEDCRNKDNTSSHLTQRKEIGCNIHAENTQCLDVKRRLERKDEFSRIRGTAQSWT